MKSDRSREAWDTIPLRYVCKLNPPVSFDDLREDDDVTFLPMDKVKAGYFVPHVEKVAGNAASYNAFKEGDILLAKVTPCFENGNIAIAENLIGGRGFGSSELFVLRPTGVRGRFLFYSLRSPLFKQEGEASMTGAGGLKRVSPDVLRQYRIGLPNESTQQAIADYLDRETARLDALIAAKERLLGLLAEKRQALITRAVTRGLDPNAPLRDSGIPWLGPIPAHWETKRGKWIFRQSAMPVRDHDEIVTCFRDGQVTLRRNRREDGFMVAEKEVGYQGIRKGQLILHSMDAFAGAIGVSDSDGKCSPEYIICEPREPRLDSFYYGFLLRWMALAGFIQASCPAVRERAPRIRFNDLAEMLLPIPPLDEQIRIVAMIDKEAERLRSLFQATERTISLLKERRSALIAAAVTGQIPIPSESIP